MYLRKTFGSDSGVAKSTGCSPGLSVTPAMLSSGFIKTSSSVEALTRGSPSPSTYLNTGSQLLYIRSGGVFEAGTGHQIGIKSVGESIDFGKGGKLEPLIHFVGGGGAAAAGAGAAPILPRFGWGAGW